MLSLRAKRCRSSTQLLLCLIKVVSKRWMCGRWIFNHKVCPFCLFLVYLLHNVVHGSQATPVYTLMLRCSQNAPPSVRTACYSFLGTLEILGKQLSLFMAGVLTESFGYVPALNISLVVSFSVVILVRYCPKNLRWSHQDLQYGELGILSHRRVCELSNPATETFSSIGQGRFTSRILEHFNPLVKQKKNIVLALSVEWHSETLRTSHTSDITL